jgi:cytochrome c
MQREEPFTGRRRAMLTQILLVLIVAVLVVPTIAGCGSGSDDNAGEEWVQTELYLGLNIPGDGVVGEADFQRFLEEVVSVEFPLGLTVFDAYGQMLEQDGDIEKQQTKVVLLVHQNDDASRQAVERVISAYRERFGGPQVMHTTSPIEVEFFEGDQAAMEKRQEVVAFVQEAVAYAQANGKEKALAEFSDPNGSFKRGELYIYAYDFDGNVLGHGGDASLIGKNLIDYEDPNGVKVIQGLIAVAREGQGWFPYTWNNPQSGKQEPKLGYVMKVDDTWWLGSGTYGN